MRWAIFLLAIVPLHAWWQVGHKAIAGVAYDLLNQKARERVDQLIRIHPDYGKFVAGAPDDAKPRARFAFMEAAYWADELRTDPRFWDDTKRDASATPLVPGFPDMKRHTKWHYYDVPFSTDGTPVPEGNRREPNMLDEIIAMAASIGKELPASEQSYYEQVYMLPWLLHLVGDAHQPLHCVTRYRKGQNDPKTGEPWGDLGGNTVNLSNGMNLHAYWDSLPGQTDTPAVVEAVVRLIEKRGREAHPVTDPEAWVKEGVEISKSVVYSFGNEGGSKDNPAKISTAYTVEAKQVAYERAGLAAHRLAALLNDKLGR